MSTKVAGSEGVMGAMWTGEDNGYDGERGDGCVGAAGSGGGSCYSEKRAVQVV